MRSIEMLVPAAAGSPVMEEVFEFATNEKTADIGSTRAYRRPRQQRQQRQFESTGQCGDREQYDRARQYNADHEERFGERNDPQCDAYPGRMLGKPVGGVGKQIKHEVSRRKTAASLT